MIDTLKLARRLTDKGMDREQAEALADELNEGLKELAVTKEVLDSALSRLRAEAMSEPHQLAGEGIALRGLNGQPTYTFAEDGRAITCRRCGLTSYHQQDVRMKYCAHCQAFHSEGKR